jgi:hypothetical protein
MPTVDGPHSGVRHKMDCSQLNFVLSTGDCRVKEDTMKENQSTKSFNVEFIVVFAFIAVLLT